MKKIMFFVVAVISAVILTGCGHNINVQGWGFACPYGAMGYGTFSCTKDNVKVVSTEKTTKDGVESRNEFVVGEQVTGSDVELKKVDSGK